MTDIIEAGTQETRRKGAGLDSMLLPELKQLGSKLGLKGTGTMRKSALIDAIKSAQSSSRAEKPARAEQPSTEQPSTEQRGTEQPRAEESTRTEQPRTRRQRNERAAESEQPRGGESDQPQSPPPGGTDDVAARLEALKAEGSGRNRRRGNNADDAERTDNRQADSRPQQQQQAR
ncbi:MAG TPA: Rho termination factor N-terminal domain-containing protein, partial [Propionicimonas sp.]|nr:Rho termination factor N-terminal domain-containing protein [Propionicimonas sp.]